MLPAARPPGRWSGRSNVLSSFWRNCVRNLSERLSLVAPLRRNLESSLNSPQHWWKLENARRSKGHGVLMDLKTLMDTPPWDWPEDAGDLLLETLIDNQACGSDRLIAAELAGDSPVMNDELAKALLAIVGTRDDTDELRAQAAISLGPVLE